MIDGFKCTCVGLDPIKWYNCKLLNFGVLVSEQTGEILRSTREAKVNGLNFVLSKAKTGCLVCGLAGSLHKYYNKGVQNWDVFTVTDIRSTLKELEHLYNIPLKDSVLHGLEVGVNIPLSYKPQRIIKSVICHKGKPFKEFSNKGRFLGVVCEHSDYDIKIYDKGYNQNVLNVGYILRFEIRFKRMRLIENSGITTLADLEDSNKLEKILPFLLAKINEIIFFDFYVVLKGLTEKQLLKWQRFSNYRYWESLNRKQYYNARILFAELTAKYKAKDGAKFLAKEVSNIYHLLLQSKLQELGRFPHDLLESKQIKTGTFSNLEYMAEKVTPKGEEDPHEEKQPKEVEKNDTKKRCKTCGRDISSQRGNSVFCSERLHGKAAKRCRNKDSNRRMIIKRKIVNSMKKERLLLITYEHNGEKYTDKLCPNELLITREWLDRVVSVVVIDESTTESEREAKELLTQYLKSHEKN